MDQIEYDNRCDEILQSTMKYVDTANMKSYANLNKQFVNSDDPVYVSAAASRAPITLAFTPAGTGKSSLIEDRIKLLQASGVLPQNIIALNMNIAKVKQMSRNLPGVRVMTFNDFTHNIFRHNHPECELSDLESIAATLRLLEQNNLVSAFIKVLSMPDPKARLLTLTMFCNQYKTFSIGTLKAIRKSDYALESMIVQNELYSYQSNPYDGTEAILINGVTNMSLPILCSIIEYCNKYHCNLFMTGSPDETLYEYQMAYSKAMNVMSAYNSRLHIDIIRLTKPKKISKDILNMLEMHPTAKIPRESVSAGGTNMDYGKSVIDAATNMFNINYGYLQEKLKNKERVLILARSRQDIKDLKTAIVNCYFNEFPNMNILDLTERQVPVAIYGKTASEHIDELKERYPNGVAVNDLFGAIYSYLNEAEQTATPYIKSMYNTAKNELVEFENRHMDMFISADTRFELMPLVQCIIDLESREIQATLELMQKNDSMDLSNSDIVLSTVHTAMDIRMDHVVIFLKTNKNDEGKVSMEDDAFYRVALSRANKTEYIFFANYGEFEIPHQTYIRNHRP